MQDIIYRQALDDNMEEIFKLVFEVFCCEQKIASELIHFSEDKQPIWFCVLKGGSIVGAAAAWEEEGMMHWGRFAIRKDARGYGIGTKLAKYSFDCLFTGEVTELYMEARDATVRIVCALGGKVIGEPQPFFLDTVTPVVLRKKDYEAITK